VQIQGKAHEPPVAAYQKRIKDWMETMPEEDRPKWTPQENWDLTDLHSGDGDDGWGGGFAFYHPGDYGLAKPDTRNEWDAIVQDAYDHPKTGTPYSYGARALALGAHQHNDHEGLQKALDIWHNSEKINHRSEWEAGEGNDEFLNHEVAYEDKNPSPDYGDPESPYEAWEDEMHKAIKPSLDQIWRQRWEESPQREFVHNTETEMAKVQNEAAQGQTPEIVPSESQPRTAGRHRAPHSNYSTGEPCFCTFQYQPDEWHTAAYANEGDPMRCPTCGDPIEHGKCLRCNWGGWSNAMGPNDPIADPTKEVKPFVGES
jgi:hypothetical protein